ncbi:MAG: hypothetical protein ABR950_06980 [Candidatus Dormibacteria bacterium]|jgi:hypothetical protein
MTPSEQDEERLRRALGRLMHLEPPRLRRVEPHARRWLSTLAVASGTLVLTAGVLTTALELHAGSTGPGASSSPPAAGVTVTPPPETPSSWHLVSAPDAPGATDGELNGVACADANDCWAVGSWDGPALDGFTTGSGGGGAGSVTSHTLIEQYSGGGWRVITSPTPSGSDNVALVAVACAGASDCWAVGFDLGVGDEALVEQYTGAGWSTVTIPAPAGSDQTGLDGVTCVSSTDCWAVGYSSQGQQEESGYSQGTLVEQYTGSGWAVVSSPDPPGSTSSRLQAVTCTGVDDCWAVGSSGMAGGNQQPLIERDAGSGWTIVAGPNPPDTREPSILTGVSCAGADDCWTVGDYGPSGDGRSLIEHFTGSGWTLVPSPAPVSASITWRTALSAVTCAGDGDCWATGSLTATTSASSSLAFYTSIEQESGGGWSVVHSPSPPGSTMSELNGIACTGDRDCWAVGISWPIATLPGRPLIEQEP